MAAFDSIFGNPIMSYGLLLGSLFTKKDGGLNTFLRNLFHKESGSALTDAEVQANEFNASEAQKQRDWQEMMSNTSYQRQVADMKAAGLNPMMAASGSGAAVPSGSSASSVSPSGSAGLLNFLLGMKNFGLQRSLVMQQIQNLRAQERNTEASTQNVVADTAKKESETAGQDIDNKFREEYNRLRNDAQEAANSVSREQLHDVRASIRKKSAEIDKLIAETHSEEERKELIVAQRILAETEARNVEYLRPYIAAEKAANSQLAKSAAKLNVVKAAYEQGMIDAGAIEAAVRADNASASHDEVETLVSQFKQSIRDGSLAAASSGVVKLVESLYTGIVRLTSAVVGGK